MFELNPHFSELSTDYLFSGIAEKIRSFQAAAPHADIIRLGIGDVTLPLIPAVIEAMHQAVDEMADGAGFRGYGPEQGYEFLREAIALHDYRQYGLSIEADDIFVSDGSKCDLANIQELFSTDCRVAIGDPVYPVYRDSNILAGRGSRILYMPCREGNDFTPEPPKEPAALIYLCSPNNPTGKAMTRRALSNFVEYAHRHRAIILFDAAYCAYVSEEDIPRSIYEIDGADEVAIEFRSFSKTAGFTGLRCAYAALPKTLPDNLHGLWKRRQSGKFNGVSYIVQRAAEAVYSEDGKAQIRSQIEYYMYNAKMIGDGLRQMGYTVHGGLNAPYLWWRLPGNIPSADFFDILLEQCRVVGTPGAGFGKCGEGYFRLTAFGNRMRTMEALERIRKWNGI